MKMPKRRTKNRQAREARKVLDDENQGGFCLRIDKSLKMQFNLIAQFKKTSMNTILNNYVKKYVEKNYSRVGKGCENLSEQEIRRDMQ